MKGKIVSAALVTSKGKTIPIGLPNPKQSPEVKRCENCVFWVETFFSAGKHYCDNTKINDFIDGDIVPPADFYCRYWQSKEEE